MLSAERAMRLLLTLFTIVVFLAALGTPALGQFHTAARAPIGLQASLSIGRYGTWGCSWR